MEKDQGFEVDLSGEKLTEEDLVERIRKDAPKIDTLNCSAIGLRGIPDEFASLTSVKRLILRENLLEEETLQRGVLRTLLYLESLQHLDLSHNNLRGEVDFRPLKNLSTLVLGGNQIKTVHLDYYANISRVFLNDNPIQEIVDDTLEVSSDDYKTRIYLDNPGDFRIATPSTFVIEKYTSDALLDQSETTSTSSDESASTGPDATLVISKEELCRLRIKDYFSSVGDLSSIRRIVIKDFNLDNILKFLSFLPPGLRYLTMSGCSMVDPPQKAFYDLKKLEYLDISNNHLTIFPLALVSVLTNLSKLDVRGNEFLRSEIVPASIAASVNGFTLLSDFDDPKSVYEKNLSALGQAEKERVFADRRLPEYRDPGLRFDVTETPDFFPQFLSVISVLHIPHVGLAALPEEGTEALHTITDLDLSGNFLCTLPSGFFRHLINLAFLDVSNNSLVSIPKEITQSRSIVSFRCDGNPMNMKRTFLDYTPAGVLKYLKNFQGRHNLQSYDSIRNYVKKYHITGREFLELSPKDFQRIGVTISEYQILSASIDKLRQKNTVPDPVPPSTLKVYSNYSIKIFHHSDREKFRREKKLFKRLACPYVAKLKMSKVYSTGVSWLFFEKPTALLSDLVVSIFDNDGLLTEFEFRYLISNFVYAIRCLHTRGYIHGNISLNTFAQYDCRHSMSRWKICDMSAVAKIGKPLKVRPTGFRCPPEIAKFLISGGEPPVCNEKLDVWGLGILIWELLFGKDMLDSGFNDNQEEILEFLVGETRLVEFFDDKVEEDLYDFFSRCLEKDPAKRMRLDEILQHKFLRS